jgi:hypothetical protein
MRLVKFSAPEFPMTPKLEKSNTSSYFIPDLLNSLATIHNCSADNRIAGKEYIKNIAHSYSFLVESLSGPLSYN